MKKWCIGLLFVTTHVCFAQQFNEASYSFIAKQESGAVLADLDGDGDLDLLYAGDEGTGLTSHVYENVNGVLTQLSSVILQGTSLNVSVADWDNDNDLDLLIGGEVLYRNDGNFIFTDIGTMTRGDQVSKWADYDNDGDLDVLNIGWLATGTHLMRNDNGTFVDTNFDLPPGFSGDWGDFDGDGDLDFVIGGYLASSDYNGAIIYEQVADTFKLVQGNTVNAFSQVYDPQVKWVNVDSDRDLELVVTGNPISTGKIIELYDRTTTSFFKQNNALNITRTVIPSNIAAADYDNDGDFDIAIGNHGIFNNNNNGYFTVIDTVRFGKVTLGDINGDKNIDIFSSEIFTDLNETLISDPVVYFNNTAISNNKPSVPTNLTVIQSSERTYFNWSPATDDHASTNQLSYNYYVLDKDENIMSTSQTNTNKKFQLAQNGPIINYGNYFISGLPEGNYRWAVQAVDGSFTSSDFSTEKGFRVGMYVNIPDTNFLHPLIKLGYDVNLDSLISYAEAEALTSLNLSSKGIKDPTGIEAFVNLQHLNFSDNPITSLNTRTLDKLLTLEANNCGLTSVFFGTDNTLENISLINNSISVFEFKRLGRVLDIDLSQNPISTANTIGANNLVTLTLNNTTSLSTLAITNSTKLQHLSVSFSGITNLDLISNTALKTINLNDNAVLAEVCVWVFPFPPVGISTNTSNSPNLMFSPCLNEVYIPDNNFRQALIVNGADVDNDGFITYDEALTLTDIQVSYRNIQDLTGLQAFKNVRIFAAEGNQISNFDIDSIPLLENLNLGVNGLVNISLPKYPTLKYVDIRSNEINALDFSKNMSLLSLVASDNNLTSFDTDSLYNLINLDLGKNNITTLLLNNNPNIELLILAQNPITTLSLNKQRKLGYLSVDSCIALTDLHLKANFELNILVANNTSLSFLDIKNNTQLSSLNLAKNPSLNTVCVWALPFPVAGIVYTPNLETNMQFSLCIQDSNSWVNIGNYPLNGIRYTSGFVINDTAYVGTGFTDQYESSYWAFDPITESWEQKADFPGRLPGFGKGYSANNQGYVITHTDVLGDFWKYDAANNTWTLLLAPTGGGNSFYAGFVVNNDIYLHGGAQSSVKTNAFWRFETASQTWTQMAVGPEARSQAFGFAKDSVGFIGGGSSASNQTLSDFWKYHVPSNTWEQLSNLAQANKEAVSVSHQGRLFYGGGLDAGNSPTNQWIEYLPGADSMVTRSNLPGPMRAGAIALSAGNFIYFGTGYNGANSFNDWWKYQTSELTSINSPQRMSVIQVYPNPAIDHLYFNHLENNTQIHVMDLRGTIVYSTVISNSMMDIPSSLANGTYLLSIQNNHTHAITKVVLLR